MSLGKTTLCSWMSRTSFCRGRIPQQLPLRLPQMLRFPMGLLGVTAPMTAEGLSGRSCHAAWQLWANHGPAAVIDSSERAGTVKSGTFVYVGCYILCKPSRCVTMCRLSLLFYVDHSWHLAVQFWKNIFFQSQIHTTQLHTTQRSCYCVWSFKM